jgi:hypothetical protein
MNCSKDRSRLEEVDPPGIEDAVEASLPVEDEAVHEAEVAHEVEEVHDTDDKPLPTFTVYSYTFCAS